MKAATCRHSDTAFSQTESRASHSSDTVVCAGVSATTTGDEDIGPSWAYAQSSRGFKLPLYSQRRIVIEINMEVAVVQRCEKLFLPWDGGVLLGRRVP